MVNLTVGVYNIDSESVESIFNINPDALTNLASVYTQQQDFALWIKNHASNEIAIFTANNNVLEVRNAITALLD